LTPARALVAEIVRRYAVLDIECTNLEVQKLAWFLQRTVLALGLADPLRLTFVADKYGPYSDGLRHLLNAMDGSYLHCKKRLADAGPLDPIWFESSKRQRVADYLTSESCRTYVPALEATTRLVDGFESPLGMELMATVDWLVQRERCEASVPAVLEALGRWPGGRSAADRKLRVFDARLIDLALQRLQAFAS